jgi:hypothetical protein
MASIIRPITTWTGPLCLTAATLIVSSELLRLVVGLVSGPDGARSPAHTLAYGLALTGMYALLLALTAVYVGHQQSMGRLGLIGYLTASAGTLLVAGDWWFEAFAVPMIGTTAPDVLKQPAGGSVVVGAIVTAGLFANGWILFGVAALRSGTFSRPASALLIVGGVCGILALSTPFQVPLAAAVGWIGYTLRRASRHEVPVVTAGSASHFVARLPSRQH